jgi:hypothetical protein
MNSYFKKEQMDYMKNGKQVKEGHPWAESQVLLLE